MAMFPNTALKSKTAAILDQISYETCAPMLLSITESIQGDKGVGISFISDDIMHMKCSLTYLVHFSCKMTFRYEGRIS